MCGMFASIPRRLQEVRFIHWYVFFLILITSTLCAVYIFFVPKMLIGEFFFGGYAPAYNIQIAKFFFSEALRWDGKEGMPPPYAYHQISRTAFIEGNLNESLRLLEEELRYYPEHYHTYYIKGLTLGYMGRERDAIVAFEEFIKREPDSWAARNDAAWLYFRIGEIEKGLALIAPAAKTHPENPWVLNTYGVLLMNLGRDQEALVAFRHALNVANAMTPDDWGRAYPGNSHAIYSAGLERMRASINENILLLQHKNPSIF